MEELLWIVGIVVMFLFMGECIGEYIYSRGKTTFREANFQPFETVLYTTENDFSRTVLRVGRIDEVQYATNPFHKDVRYAIYTDEEQIVIDEKNVICRIDGNNHDELNRILAEGKEEYV